MIHNIPQPDFEQLIAKKLASGSNVEIRKNHTFVSVEQVRLYFISFLPLCSIPLINSRSSPNSLLQQ